MTTNEDAFDTWYKNSTQIVEHSARIYYTSKEAWQAATTEANKRIAELEQMYRGAKILLDFNTQKNPFLKEMAALESEVAELKVDINEYIKISGIQASEITELQADNNRLREALGKIVGHDMACSVIAKQALSATPSESLQAHDDELIEKCAKVCDGYIKATFFAHNIRALKEVK